MIAGRQWDIGLTLACCLLVGGLAYEIWAPLGEFDLPAVTIPERPQPPAIAPYNPPPQATFAAIDARPIFNPARKPVEGTAVAGSTTAAAPPDVVLVGVIIDPKNQMALIKREGAPFAESAALGASVDGWEVTEIAADHVALRSGTQELVLRMDAKRKIQTVQPGQTTTPPYAGQISPAVPMPYARAPINPRTPTTKSPPAAQDGGDETQQRAGNMVGQ